MLNRFRLERKGTYERLVIAERLTQMLESFIEGKAAPVEMGSEQGGIPHWDDFVLKHPDGMLEHVQIKRQIVNFSASASVRPSGVALSALDEALSSLAAWSKPEPGKVLDSRKFVLEIPSQMCFIKGKLRVSHLEELCGVCRLAGVHEAGLAARMSTDGPTKRAYEWLTTWCGFDGWTHIIAALSRLTIKVGGVDSDLEERALTSLRRHFFDAEKALETLLAYIGREAADVTSITCPPVLQHLYSLARSEVVRWTQYHFEPTGAWSISGTHGIVTGDLETATSVVNGLWQDSGGQRRLRIVATCPMQDPSSLTITAALLRLALHLQGGSQGLLLGKLAWHSRASKELGHTLGVSDSDFEYLAWLDDNDRLTPSTFRALNGLAGARAEADALALAMDDEVWKQVVAKIQARLNFVADLPLLQALETMWVAWREELNLEPALKSELFARLLYPQGEGRNSAHALRVGPRTVDLIVVAIETILLVAVAVGGDASTWSEFPECGAVNAIALRRWSGPAGSSDGVSELTSHGLAALIGSDMAPVIILSGVDESPSTVLEVGMADDASSGTSMGAPRYPQLLVTRSKIERYLKRGTLETVRQHFGAQWRANVEARQTAIQSFDIGA